MSSSGKEKASKAIEEHLYRSMRRLCGENIFAVIKKDRLGTDKLAEVHVIDTTHMLMALGCCKIDR